jgi:hypothetical protein
MEEFMPKRRKTESGIDPAFILIVILACCIASFFIGLNYSNWFAVLASLTIGGLVIFGLIRIMEKETGVPILKPLIRKFVREKPIEKEETTVKEGILFEIIQRIEEFSLPKKPKNEEECEVMLVSHLQAFFPNIRRQEQYPDMRIDAVIGKIGIEIKFQPTLYDFHALYSQIEDRLKYLDTVIVTLFSEMDKQATNKFKDKLKERGWLNSKVFVISKV